MQDQDRGGNISSEEFGRVMRKTNPAISDEEVAKIISEVDLDGDGTINFDGEWRVTLDVSLWRRTSSEQDPIADQVISSDRAQSSSP